MVGTSAIGTPARNLGHLAVGTHHIGSAIEPEHPFVAIGGVYIENAGASPAVSATTPGSGQMVVMSNWGEMFTTGAPKTASHVSTSTNLIKNGSGIVFGFSAGWTNANAGDPIQLDDGLGNAKFSIVTGGSSGFESFEVPEGGVAFDTTIVCKRSNTGGGETSMVVIYR